MEPSKPALFSLLAAASQHVLATNTSYITGDGIHSEGDLPPWSLPNNTWDGAMSQHNATGLSFFNAPDVSLAASNSATNSWKVSIGVSADIPLVDSPVYDINQSLVFTGTEVKFEALPFQANPNATWQACVIISLPGLTDSGNEKGQNTNRDHCRFIPDECTSSLEQQASRMVGETDETEDVCDGIRGLSTPTQCKDYLDLGFQTMFTLNESQALKGGTLFSYGDIPHERGNLTAYNEAVKKVWSILMVWRVMPKNGGSNPVVMSTAGFECLRADNITNGSHVPGNAGMPLRLPTLSTWVPLVLGVMALVLV